MPDTSAIRPGTGANFERYWTKNPEGLARWATSPHPWSTLYAQLVKHVNPEFAKRLTETYFRKVFGIKSGYRRGDNPVGPG